MYQRFARVRDRREVQEIREELSDRFGPPPEEVENLLTLVDLRALAAGLNIDSLVYSEDCRIFS